MTESVSRPPMRAEKQEPLAVPSSHFDEADAVQSSARMRQAAGAVMALPAAADVLPVDREQYGEIQANGIQLVADQPVSTLSIDVDTASYANIRRMLNEGRLPPANAVRIEEMINYFDYADARPTDRDLPFLLHAEVAPTPWNGKTRLLRVAMQAWDVAEQDLPPSNLVFLVDVSGSMNSADKLPLLKQSLLLLSRRLGADDRVSIVVYAGAAGVVLEPTPGNERARIAQALNELSAGGSTHGSAGIKLAYAKAREAFIEGGINRVIIATDGDFNVGTVDHQALLDLVEHERRSGIALTTLGFGRGNINDHLMEQLADHGNGNYGYIDSLMEAQKVLVEQIGGTLYTVASDVKLQVEFNPARVAEYRLIGYENRLLAREDFNNDQVDAGDLGAGHSIVALYEIAETGSDGRRIDDLRYATTASAPGSENHANEYAHVRLRYKPNGERSSRLITQPVTDQRFDARGSDDLRFAAAVAAFGQRLRGGEHLEGFGYDVIGALAREARGDDPNGYRSDFLRLVALADSLTDETPQVARAGND
ncbi:MAG: von Willebrand factor type A domain-containing protein [Gammaproteobacteria bacterium]|nr:von Willebrand factor type A domain-containing protein [Gammaproteobacteria bacterium]